ncbi:MAG: hypothetical protein TREMPRED_001369 [Tremellales sp. Tagirdzhanova-0007]|nr:MAG: hypothetical protein TREMPRED_001369 [Tremellales sp. Tagirdzhanova-0007]
MFGGPWLDLAASEVLKRFYLIMAESQEEKAHWRSVLRAFDGYMQYHLSANHARRMAFLSLPKEQKQLYADIGYREKLEAVDEGIRRNAEFIDEMIADPVFANLLEEGDQQSHHSHSYSQSQTQMHSLSPSDQYQSSIRSDPEFSAKPHTHSHSRSSLSPSRGRPTQADTDLAQDKIRSILRSFVRDWSEEGAHERRQCYEPCLDALEKHWKGKQRELGEEIKVLVPGCGLARLAMEIAARGFVSQGNEFSTYMLLASHFVLNQTTRRGSHTIFPYLHSFSNQPTTLNHLLRQVQIPDICPADVLGDGQGGAFSLIAGDFEELYGSEGDEGQRGAWGAVVTCFFIDCARNVLSYLRIIYDLLADDGIWINLGPLLWHFENSPTTSGKGEGSIELSLDEVKDLAGKVGFQLHDERTVATGYTGAPDGMLRHEYQAAFWTATKGKRS